MTRAYGYSLASRLVAAVGGVATVEMVARKLAPETQGIYYAFISVQAVQFVLEMGLTGYLVVRGSHHAVGWGRQSDPGMVAAGFAALFRGAVKWYAGLAVAAFLVFYFMGLWSIGGKTAEWSMIWLYSCLIAAAQLLFQPLLAMVEAGGLVAESALIRLLQTVATQCGALVALVLGAGLASLAWSQAAMLGVTALGLCRWRHHLAAGLRKTAGACGFDWWQEIWPVQWRGFFVWGGVFVMGALPTLMILNWCGKQAAGEWGMACRLFETILFAGSAMFTTQAAVLGTAFAGGRFSEMTTGWRRTMAWGLGITALGCFAVPVGLRLLSFMGCHFPERAGPLQLHLLLAALMVVKCANWGIEIFVRSAGNEPYLNLSVIRIVVTTVLLSLVVPVAGPVGAALVLLAVAAGLVLPWNCRVMRGALRSWRSATPAV